MRLDIEFISKGSLWCGWLYIPDQVKDKRSAPSIVMAHGKAGLKEMGLDGFAQYFSPDSCSVAPST